MSDPRSIDPYLEHAIALFEIAPNDVTKAHRDAAKRHYLAVQYGGTIDPLTLLAEEQARTTEMITA